MRTKAGYLPKEKEMLNEDLIAEDSQFYEIIKEREDIFHEYIVKKKIKKRKLQSFSEFRGVVNPSSHE
mgnify:CR=1 FL=1